MDEQSAQEDQDSFVIFEKGDSRKSIIIPFDQYCVGIACLQDNKEFGGKKPTAGEHVGLQVDFARAPTMSKVLCIGQFSVAGRPALLHLCIAPKQYAYVSNPKSAVPELFWISQKVYSISNTCSLVHVVFRYQALLVTASTNLQRLVTDWSNLTNIKVDQLSKLAA